MEDKPCKDHPDAPHGFDRNASHNADRYVCECESWEEKHMSDDLVYRLRKRAEIRRQISTRKSVQEGKPDRIADLLEEAADYIEREWVGLTDEEIHDMNGYKEDRRMYRFARAIESKLKDKNHG